MSARSGRRARRVDAVTFDFWNTLMTQDPAVTRTHRRVAWRSVLHGRGHHVPDEVLDAVFVVAAENFDASWKAGVQYTFEHGVADAAALLGVDLDDADHEALRDAWHAASVASPVQPAPHVAETLAELRNGGVRCAVICDVGMAPSTTLRRFLEQFELLGSFDHFSFSDEVGVYKPDPRIFAHALAGVGVDDPARALHVGDIRRTDVAGALGAGMVAVRFRGVADDAETVEAPEAPHVIDDLRALLSLVFA